MRKLICLLICLLLNIAFTGCEPRVEPKDQAVLVGSGEEFVLTIVLDLSGSFVDQMSEQGRAYEFVVAALGRYMKEKDATDKLVFAQISGTDVPLMWEGSVKDFRRDFPSGASFRSFLERHAGPGGSRVHEGATRAIRYVMSRPRVARKEAKSVALILSDMDDTSGDPSSEGKLVDAIKDYVNAGSGVGLYFVRQDIIDKYLRHFGDAGLKGCVVEGDFVGHPTFPDFEQ